MSTITGSLTSTGWTTWDDVRAQLSDDPCLWIDLAGAHHGPAPAALPVATHLWSWRTARWARLRIDGRRVLATFLTEGDTAGGTPIVATVADGIPWGRHDRAARWEESVTLISTEGAASITFAAMISAT